MTHFPTTPANPAQGVSARLTPEQVADHIGVTPYSDMRPFVVQAVKYARERDAAIEAGGQAVAHVLPSELGWLDEPDHLGEPRLRKKAFEQLSGEKSIPLYTHPAPSGQAVAWPSSLAEELAERAKRQMLDTEREAFQAAQSGDKARQSIASTESERHRAVYHAMCLILEDQRKNPAIPRAENCGRYLAEVNDGRLLYLNHASTWQECPNFITARAALANGGKDEAE